LQGECYVYLTDLCFLQGPGRAAKTSLIEQAEKVRPYNAVVQFAAGREAALQGDLVTALKYWKRAFDSDPEIRSLIIESIASKVPARFFLETFEPGTDGLAHLFHFYWKLDRDEDARTIASQYVMALEQDVHLASTQWSQAQVIYSYLGIHDRALECGRRAVKLDPTSFSKRRALATLFMENGRFSEAVEQLRWCLRRRPEDEQLSLQLANAKRQSISQGLPGSAASANSRRQRL
jgi:tetratricopeptide (TPR) repeat protein